MFSALFVVVVGALAPRTGRICRRVAMSSSSESHFDYLVIGGGSGGIASARRAATYGAKVAVVERGALGGTCVNVGCVPKKVMWNAAHITEVLHDAALYQYRGDLESVKLDWGALKTARDNYVTRLNGIYGRNLDNSEVTKLVGTASFDGATAVRVGEKVYTADHVLVAVGGTPTVPEGLEGAEHCITSDGFFELEELPASVAVVGAGYIAVEMAGILNALGAETSLLIRGDLALRSFDDLLSTTLDAEMKRQGMTVVPQTTVASVALDEETGLKTVVSTDGVEVGKFEQVLIATGRRPLTEPLCLDKVGVELDSKGYVVVDDFQATTAPGVYALGDVCGNVELTPMAIAAGRRLADRLFGGMPLAKADYDNVPTVVFSHPTIGTIGLTEAQARDRYGDDDVAVYKSTFVNLWYGPMPIEPADKPKTAMKLVCVGPEEKVVGLHVIGMGADEMLQGFGVAMKMGATKADFDSCVAIHPTAAEEFVTLPVWGMAGSTPAKLGKTEKKEEVSAR
ncbi:hypothetical protein CTAYLR_004341 [Chrysophaeum taylorii]|uniref:Glutathione reductase n=1 Tax=Chrysophaeum taylorii TaxID=2483200 RepID=A0AAD7UNC5_9STRA|nr:hypothetical protein CTAYLR_004341 [Chrysophaeum taylorii]